MQESSICLAKALAPAPRPTGAVRTTAKFCHCRLRQRADQREPRGSQLANRTGAFPGGLLLDYATTGFGSA